VTRVAKAIPRACSSAGSSPLPARSDNDLRDARAWESRDKGWGGAPIVTKLWTITTSRVLRSTEFALIWPGSALQGWMDQVVLVVEDPQRVNGLRQPSARPKVRWVVRALRSEPEAWTEGAVTSLPRRGSAAMSGSWDRSLLKCRSSLAPWRRGYPVCWHHDLGDSASIHRPTPI